MNSQQFALNHVRLCHRKSSDAQAAVVHTDRVAFKKIFDSLAIRTWSPYQVYRRQRLNQNHVIQLHHQWHERRSIRRVPTIWTRFPDAPLTWKFHQSRPHGIVALRCRIWNENKKISKDIMDVMLVYNVEIARALYKYTILPEFRNHHDTFMIFLKVLPTTKTIEELYKRCAAEAHRFAVKSPVHVFVTVAAAVRCLTSQTHHTEVVVGKEVENASDHRDHRWKWNWPAIMTTANHQRGHRSPPEVWIGARQCHGKDHGLYIWIKYNFIINFIPIFAETVNELLTVRAQRVILANRAKEVWSICMRPPLVPSHSHMFWMHVALPHVRNYRQSSHHRWLDRSNWSQWLARFRGQCPFWRHGNPSICMRDTKLTIHRIPTR